MSARFYRANSTNYIQFIKGFFSPYILIKRDVTINDMADPTTTHKIGSLFCNQICNQKHPEQLQPSVPAGMWETAHSPSWSNFGIVFIGLSVEYPIKSSFYFLLP